MSIVKPSPKVLGDRAERLDFLRARLLHLKKAGELRGAPGWLQLRAVIEGAVEMEKRREKKVVDDCERSEKEPWEIVSAGRACRAARRSLEFVLDAVDRNEDQVRILSEDVRRQEKEFKEYEQHLKDLGETDHAD